MPFPSCRAAKLACCLLPVACWLSAGCQTSSSSQARNGSNPRPAAGGPAPRLEIADRSAPGMPKPMPPRPQAMMATTPTTTRPPAPLANVPTKPETVIRATAPMPVDPQPPAASTPKPDPVEQPLPLKPVPPENTPSQAKPPSGPERLRELHKQAAAKYQGVNDYIARFRRREVVNGKQQPEDLMLMRFRKNPFSVYFKWLEGTAAEGRECIYVKGQYNNQIKTRTGRGDILSGMRLDVDPHSTRATANSRRTIEEAGIGNLIDRLGTALSAEESGAKTFGTFQYLGPRQRPESAVPMEAAVQHVPAGLEKHLPRGGQRFWYFNVDPNAKEHGLPILIITLDETNKEVEYYCYDRLNINVGLRPEEFDPDALWGKR